MIIHLEKGQRTALKRKFFESRSNLKSCLLGKYCHAQYNNEPVPVFFSVETVTLMNLMLQNIE